MSPLAMQRWLVGSAVFNVFVVCGIAGGAWRWWTFDRQQTAVASTAAQPRGLRYAADGLAPEQRRVFLIGLRDARRDVAVPIQTARDGRQEVLRLMAAPQLDRTALAAALQRTRDADALVRTRVEASVVEFTSMLTVADREKLASGLAQRSGLGPSSTPPRNP